MSQVIEATDSQTIDTETVMNKGHQPTMHENKDNEMNIIRDIRNGSIT